MFKRMPSRVRLSTSDFLCMADILPRLILLQSTTSTYLLYNCKNPTFFLSFDSPGLMDFFYKMASYISPSITPPVPVIAPVVVPDNSQPRYQAFRIRKLRDSTKREDLRTWLNELPYFTGTSAESKDFDEQNVLHMSLEKRPDDKGMIATVTFENTPKSFANFTRGKSGRFKTKFGLDGNWVIVDSNFLDITPLHSGINPSVE
jgi:hypothetical protein